MRGVYNFSLQGPSPLVAISAGPRSSARPAPAGYAQGYSAGLRAARQPCSTDGRPPRMRIALPPVARHVEDTPPPSRHCRHDCNDAPVRCSGRTDVGQKVSRSLARAFMHDPAPFQQHGVVGHFLRQGVLEGQFEIRKQSRLIGEIRPREDGLSRLRTSSSDPSATAHRRTKGTSLPMTEAA